MTAPLANTLEQTLLAHRLITVDVPWENEIVFPRYDGLSIRNVPHTALRLLDADPPAGFWGSAPLDARLWEGWTGQVQRVVVFITDGLGWRLLNEIMAEDDETAQTVADLLGESGALVPLTSVAPSTTAVALPTLWTGAVPAATGMVGTTLFLREFDMLCNLLFFRPENGRHRREALEDWGLDFDEFLPVRTLGEWLRKRGIRAYLLMPKALYSSGLSRLIHRGIRRVARFSGYTDLWIGLRDLLHKTRRKRCLIGVYWDALDAISHLHGAVTEQAVTEVRRQLADLRAVLTTPGVSDGRTLFLLVADHGHAAVTEHVVLSEHAPLAEALRCAPGGESRLAYLYLRHDYRPAVMDYIGAHLGDKVAAILPQEALAAGLFGPGAAHAETGPRLGDLVLVAREGVSIDLHAPRANASRSKHGGLSAREMLVPLLARGM